VYLHSLLPTFSKPKQSQRQAKPQSIKCIQRKINMKPKQDKKK